MVTAGVIGIGLVVIAALFWAAQSAPSQRRPTAIGHDGGMAGMGDSGGSDAGRGGSDCDTGSDGGASDGGCSDGGGGDGGGGDSD